MSCAVSDKNKKRVWKDSSKEKLALRGRTKYLGSSNPNYKGGGKLCRCLGCNVEFKIPLHNQKHEKHSGKYCSKTCCYDTWRKNKMSTSQRRLNKLFARNISRIIKTYSERTADKWLGSLNYTRKDLKNHIEKQFTQGMTWDNYGKEGWHIDHIKPVSYFIFDDGSDLDFKKCWALSNLQPLWEKDNLSKGGSNTKINIKNYGKK